MRSYLKEHTNPPVFLGSAAVVLVFVLYGVIAPAQLGTAADSALSFIADTFGWLYLFSATGFLVLIIGLMLSRYGSIRLGPNDSRPEYSNLSWFAMLFTAGMGIGLVYYAVAEPVTHFNSPPTGQGGTPEAAQNAMVYTFYHWGFHPWAIYILLATALGYFSYRRGLPLRPASALYSLIGDRIYGWQGSVVDVLAVFGTLFGLATSLGLGARQVGSGLDTLFGLPNNVVLQVAIIAAITSVAVVSIMLGIDKGVRNLSLLNLWLAFALMVGVFVVGSSLGLVNVLASNVGNYLSALPGLSLETFPNNEGGQAWQASWTLFYWGWWISWSPFVGMFLARISYGRTIRNFVAGALFLPVGASAVWLTVFGDSALSMLLQNADNPVAKSESDPANGIFVLLQQLNLPDVLVTVGSVLAVLVVVLFFATSSDSGSLVVDILTNGGDPNPKWQQRLFWALMEGVVAAVLLVSGALAFPDDPGKALSALQAASIAAGLPFAVVLILMAAGLMRSLRAEDIDSPSVLEPPPLAGLREYARMSAGPKAESGNLSDEQVRQAQERFADEESERRRRGSGSREPAQSRAKK